MIQEDAYIPSGEFDEFVATRKKGLLQYISEGANVEDLEAAGYTPEEIDGILSKPEPMTTSKEFDRDRQGGSAEYGDTYGTLSQGSLSFQDKVGEFANTLGPRVDGVAYDARSLPANANPEKDPTVGQDDLGRPIRKSWDGTEYLFEVQPRKDASIAKEIYGALREDPLGATTELAKGVAQGLVDTASIPYRAWQGEPITIGDIIDFASMTTLGAGAMSAPKGPLRTTPASVQPDNPTTPARVQPDNPTTSYKPKMFSSGEINLKPGMYSIADFYSPTVETIRNTEFPSKGYKGKELLKLLRDKTPGVRSAELTSMNLGIDPTKYYNKEEILGLAEKNSYRVTAEVVDNDPAASYQRQIIKDREVKYSTIKINATPVSEETPSFLPMRGYTHYDPETISHVRVSIRENQNGEMYLLVEELQSDLLQNGSIKPRGPISVNDAYEEVLSLVSKDVPKSPSDSIVYQQNLEYFNNYFKIAAEDSRQYDLGKKGLFVPQEDIDNYEILVEEIKVLREGILKTVIENGTYQSFQKLETFFETAGVKEGSRIDRRTKAVGLSPISRDSDTVRLALQAAMARASESNVSSIVIPNLERILAADRARPGSEVYGKYMQPGSGFQRTYGDGVEKFIKQLQDEYGDAIRIEKVDLPYFSEKQYYRGEEINIPSTAIKIDFSGLKGVDLRVGKFAQGGIVEDNQMNRLFEEGGIADDGMSREPVTGNEVPPGSLASEVRDDIDVKLSEGEYVVPADVLRYYGVRFFEDLRAQAKRGMMEMESDGRIGGASTVEQRRPQGMPQGMPQGSQDEQLTPEEEQMLQEALGTSGMAEGGSVKGFDRTQFTSVGSEASGAAGGIGARKYINPLTQEVRTFNFIGNVALGAIPDGFVPWTEELGKQVKNAPVTNSGETEKKSSGTSRPATVVPQESAQSNWGQDNYDALMADPYAFGSAALEDNVKGVGGMLPGIKDINKVNAIAEAKTALAQLDPSSEEAKSLLGKIEHATESISSPIIKGMVNTGLAGTSNNYQAQLDAEKEVRGAVENIEATSVTSSGSTNSAPSSSPRPQPKPAPVQDNVPAGPATAPPSPVQTTVVATPAGPKEVDPNASIYNPAPVQTTPYTGPRAKGGLITRPKKAPKKTRGLAGK
jgi:hypothetical protein